MPLEGKDGWGSSAPEISGVFVDVGDVGVFSLDLSVNSEASDECNISDRRFEARKKHFETNLGITSEMTSGITSINPSPLLGPRCWQGPKSRARSLGEHRLESFSGFRLRLFGLRPIWKCQPGPRLSCRAWTSWSPCSLSCAQVKKRDAEADARAYLDAHRLHEVTELCISQLHADTGFVDIASYRLYSREMPQFLSGSFRIRKDTLNSMLTWGLQKQHYT